MNIVALQSAQHRLITVHYLPPPAQAQAQPAQAQAQAHPPPERPPLLRPLDGGGLGGGLVVPVTFSVKLPRLPSTLLEKF
mgnify:CR=1 FL=1